MLKIMYVWIDNPNAKENIFYHFIGWTGKYVIYFTDKDPYTKTNNRYRVLYTSQDTLHDLRIQGKYMDVLSYLERNNEIKIYFDECNRLTYKSIESKL